MRRSDGGKAPWLVIADAVWDIDAPGFEARTRTALEPLLVSRPDDPEILWRWSRLLVAEGLSATEIHDQRRAFAGAREFAARCLDQDPRFRHRRDHQGWSIALGEVADARSRCVDQLAWAWVRWWVVSDPRAMSADGATLRALTDRAAGDEGAWARALFRATQPDRPPDSVTDLVRWAQQGPSDLARVVDAIEWGDLPPDERDAYVRYVRQSARPDAPRHVGALSRVNRLLGSDPELDD
jgi:hypothetical protein